MIKAVQTGASHVTGSAWPPDVLLAAALDGVNVMTRLLSRPIIAMLMVGFGAVIEGMGYPGSGAVAHMLYGWGIIYAIFASAEVPRRLRTPA